MGLRRAVSAFAGKLRRDRSDGIPQRGTNGFVRLGTDNAGQAATVSGFFGYNLAGTPDINRRAMGASRLAGNFRGSAECTSNGNCKFIACAWLQFVYFFSFQSLVK
jgi:hypothetical protein